MIKILILGGGFGGIRCALDLEKKFKGQAQITLVDKNSYHLFTPSLYEVASIYEKNPLSSEDPFAVKIRKTVSIPYGEIFFGPVRGKTSLKEGSSADHAFQAGRTSNGINFVQAETVEVDLKTMNVKTRGGEVLAYDYLVIALGSQTADFGIPGVREYAYQFKSIDDAVAINVKLGKLVKKMASGEKMDPLKILVGGAGFTGIEFAAEISSCSEKMCQEHNIKGKHATVILIEAGPKILPMVSNKERNIISKRLTKLGVMLMENSPIEEVGAGFVKLKNGQMLEGDMVVWTAGVRANEFLKSIASLPLTDKGKIIVDTNLQVQGFVNVFAVGDNQEFIDPKTQKPVPALAYAAIDQAKIVAKNIFNVNNGKKLVSYKPTYGVWIAPVGGKFAVANLWGSFSISGFIGWLVRELVDLRYLISILSFGKAITFFRQEITMFTKND